MSSWSWRYDGPGAVGSYRHCLLRPGEGAMTQPARQFMFLRDNHLVEEETRPRNLASRSVIASSEASEAAWAANRRAPAWPNMRGCRMCPEPAPVFVSSPRRVIVRSLAEAALRRAAVTMRACIHELGVKSASTPACPAALRRDSARAEMSISCIGIGDGRVQRNLEYICAWPANSRSIINCFGRRRLKRYCSTSVAVAPRNG